MIRQVNIMDMEQSKYLAKTLNKIGVIVYSEVNGVQHRFKLNIKELSPESVIFKNNKENIEDTQYTLIPVKHANAIYRIGKKLFDPAAYLLSVPGEQLTKSDYINTVFGKYVSEDSLAKIDSNANHLQQLMRAKADETIKDRYETLFRDAFLFAYRFFSSELKEFREQLKILYGSQDLFWKEIEKIFNDLKKNEDSLKKQNPKRIIRIADFDRPDLKTAFKLRWIPRDYETYRERLGYTLINTGFHTYSFLEHKWSESYWKINDLESARKLFFERQNSSEE